MFCRVSGLFFRILFLIHIFKNPHKIVAECLQILELLIKLFKCNSYPSIVNTTKLYPKKKRTRKTRKGSPRGRMPAQG
jgi:hypothetical protein